MKILHIVPGLGDVANGMAQVARLLAKGQEDSLVIDLAEASRVVSRCDFDTAWVHGMWLPSEWAICAKVLAKGRRLVRMVHGSLSPVYLREQGRWKKALASIIERPILRRCERIVATCEEEAGWIRNYLGTSCPQISIVDLKKYFNLPDEHTARAPQSFIEEGEVHLLYLGRRHRLKGIEYLESAVASIASEARKKEIVLRIEDNLTGQAKEEAWAWCDILVLPSVSENFGLVVAEALERGKQVITTDGAPAWKDCRAVHYIEGFRNGTKEERTRLLKEAITLCAFQ